MKTYKDIEQLMAKEKVFLLKYSHYITQEKPIDEIDIQEIIHLKKPDIYVVVLYETNEENMQKLIKQNEQ